MKKASLYLIYATCIGVILIFIDSFKHSCGDFLVRAWAQSAYEGDPARWGHLDRDKDGIACE